MADLKTILANRDAILASGKGDLVARLTWEAILQGRYRRLGLSEADMQTARDQWIANFTGKKPSPLPSNFGMGGPSGPVGTPTPRAIGPAAKAELRLMSAPHIRSIAQGGTGMLAGIAADLGQKNAQEYWQKYGEMLGPQEKGPLAWVERQVIPTMTSAVLEEGLAEYLPSIIHAAKAGDMTLKAVLSRLPPNVVRAAVATLPFSSSIKQWATNALAFGTLGAGLGGLGAKAPAEAAPAPAGPASPSYDPVVARDEGVPASEIDSHTLLDELGAPPGSLEQREDWLYMGQDDTAKMAKYQAAKESYEAVKVAKASKAGLAQKSIARSLQKTGMSPEEAKTEAIRINKEYQNLRVLKAKAGIAKTAPTEAEKRAIRAGKTAEEVMQPITKEVVAEQPQAAPLAASAAPSLEKPPAETAKPAKTYKLPPVNPSRLTIRMTREEIRNKNWNAGLERLKQDTADKLNEIMRSGDSEDVKAAKQVKLYNDFRKLEARLKAGEVGKTSGMEASGRQAAARRKASGEQVYRMKEAERLSPTQISEGKYKDFFEIWHREPKDDEIIRMDAGMTPTEAVDANYQLQWESKYRKEP